MTLYYSTPDNNIKIYNNDYLEVKLDDKADLIVTSPPYNVDINYENYKDNIPYDKYIEFTRKWLEKALQDVKEDGRMCLNIPLDKSKGRQEEGFQSVYVDLTHIAKEVGWKYFSTIIWNESNISRRTAWGSFMNASAPYVIAPVEVIVILYKGRWKKSQLGESDIGRNEFIEWTNGLWTFNGENRRKINHPAPFPLELPKRCIKLFSYINDLILDPFAGSGTTLVATSLLNRRAIGVEINAKYCEIAKNRLIKNGLVLQQRLISGGISNAF